MTEKKQVELSEVLGNFVTEESKRRTTALDVLINGTDNPEHMKIAIEYCEERGESLKGLGAVWEGRAAVLNKRAGNKEKAQEHYQRWLSSDIAPGNARWSCDMRRALMISLEMGDDDTASHAYSKLGNENHINLVDAHLHFGHPEKAIESLLAYYVDDCGTPLDERLARAEKIVLDSAGDNVAVVMKALRDNYHDEEKLLEIARKVSPEAEKEMYDNLFNDLYEKAGHHHTYGGVVKFAKQHGPPGEEERVRADIVAMLRASAKRNPLLHLEAIKIAESGENSEALVEEIYQEGVKDLTARQEFANAGRLAEHMGFNDVALQFYKTAGYQEGIARITQNPNDEFKKFEQDREFDKAIAKAEEMNDSGKVQAYQFVKEQEQKLEQMGL